MAGVTGPASGIQLVPVTQSVSGVPGRIAALVRIECRGLDALPGRRWGVLGAALLGGLVFGGLRPGIEKFYPESAPFLVLALVFGLLGRTTAAALVGGYVVADAFRYVTGPVAVQSALLYGRIAAWVLLWVLAGMVPRFARRTADSVVGAVSGLPAAATSIARPVVGGVVLAAAAFSFMQLMAYLIGPAYAARNPAYLDVAVLQEGSLLIGVVAGVLLVAVEAALRPRLGGGGDLVELMPTFLAWSLGGLVYRIVGFGVLLFLFGGLISDQLDVIVLTAAFIAGETAAFVIGRTPRIVAALVAVPELIRGAVGVAVTIGAGYILYVNRGAELSATEYFSWIVAIAIGYFAMRVLFATAGRQPAPPADGSGPAVRIPPAAVNLTVVAVVGLLVIGAPAPVFADNCTGFTDCVRGAIGAALAALAAAAAFAREALKNALKRGLEDTLLPPVIREVAPLASADGAAAQGSAFDIAKKGISMRARANGQDERADAIKGMSNGDFYQAAKGGDFADLGVAPF